MVGSYNVRHGKQGEQGGGCKFLPIYTSHSFQFVFHKIISIESEIEQKKLHTGLEVGWKIGHTIFCKRSTQFRSDLSQTFTNYFPVCDLSLALAPIHTNEQKQRQRFPKELGSCPGILSFANTQTLFSKTKVIFRISSLTCVESYIIVSGSQKQKLVPALDKILKFSLSVFCNLSTQFGCDISQTFADYSSTSSSSMIIARLLIDEHSRCYESSTNRGFCQ